MRLGPQTKGKNDWKGKRKARYERKGSIQHPDGGYLKREPQMKNSQS